MAAMAAMDTLAAAAALSDFQHEIAALAAKNETEPPSPQAASAGPPLAEQLESLQHAAPTGPMEPFSYTDAVDFDSLLRPGIDLSGHYFYAHEKKAVCEYILGRKMRVIDFCKNHRLKKSKVYEWMKKFKRLQEFGVDKFGEDVGGRPAKVDALSSAELTRWFAERRSQRDLPLTTDEIQEKISSEIVASAARRGLEPKKVCCPNSLWIIQSQHDVKSSTFRKPDVAEYGSAMRSVATTARSTYPPMPTQQHTAASTKVSSRDRRNEKSASWGRQDYGYSRPYTSSSGSRKRSGDCSTDDTSTSTDSFKPPKRGRSWNQVQQADDITITELAGLNKPGRGKKVKRETGSDRGEPQITLASPHYGLSQPVFTELTYPPNLQQDDNDSSTRLI